MSSVRWKQTIPVLLLILNSVSKTTSSNKRFPQDSFSMIDDGWRPIVGGQKRDSTSRLSDEITHYRNPVSKKSDPVKAEKVFSAKPPSLAKVEATTKKTLIGKAQVAASALNHAKIPPHSKPLYLLTNVGMHGPQIPLTMHHHRQPTHKFVMKLQPLKRKPMKQMSAYSTRDEVFVPAPSSNLGPYTFYAAGAGPQQPLKNRAQSHIEFANHFPIPNSDDEIYQIVRAPVHQYVIPKTPNQNDVHYTFQSPDDYNRNVVLSPYKFESTKDKMKKANNIKDLPKPEALISKTPFHVTAAPHQKEPTVEVQVTKEKLKVFHNAIPPHYAPIDGFTFRPVKTTLPHKIATYEVTEGKWHPETPVFQFQYIQPTKSRVPNRVITEESKPFLPTPIKPEIVPPTVPTEAEISTIYSQLANINRHKEPIGPSTENNKNFFDIKDVSTHYPILGVPDYQPHPTRFSIPDENKENEITTKNTSQEETDPTNIPSVRPQRKRPNRRRRPISTSTTEEDSGSALVPEVTTQIYEFTKMSDVEVTTQRGRRPLRFRTTSPTTSVPNFEEATTQISRNRLRKTRPTTTEAPLDTTESIEDKISRLTTTTEREFPASFESHFTAPYNAPPNTDENYPGKYTNPPSREEQKPLEEVYMDDVSSAEQDEEEKILEELKQKYEEPQKDVETVSPSLSINTPENELDYTTTSRPHRYTSTYTEETASPETTTLATTTTTTEAPKRIRGRPVKYDANNRPRFSVKEYRQRLSTTTTTSEPTTRAQNDGMRLRFPNRQRKPITIVTPNPNTEETNEESRHKFTPKEPRHQNEATEKYTKPYTVNSRLRPFGRYKSTTEASTTSKVSIKPNIFSNLRRPTPITLKNRILGRQRNATTTTKPEMTTTPDESNENETDMTEMIETTIPYSVEGSTEFGAKQTESTPVKSEIVSESKNDEFIQSQFVSDLTSSISKNEYNKPGLFKNVPSNSRKVPSYFTLATDDPILPIEAFFPNLKEKQ